MKKLIIGAVVVLTLVAIIGGLYGEKILHQFGMLKTMPRPVMVEAVTTAKAAKAKWDSSLNAVGSVVAENGITLSSEVAGTVAKIAFESGAKIEQGIVLAQLDVQVETAQLKAAEAAAELARLNAVRIRELRSRDTLAQSDLDTVEAQLQQAAAQVEGIRAAIEKKTFRAPFAGRLGIRQVNLGQFVASGQAIVTLEQLDPIHVDFALPQQRISQVVVGQDVRVTTDAAPGVAFAGRITAIDSRVDPSTRNLRVRATLVNADEKLHPGMFATVQVIIPATTPVVVIPSSSILYAPFGDSVFIVEQKTDDKTGKVQPIARQQTVRLGATQGDFVVVTSGVNDGDEVVSTGAFKLSNGAPVNVQNGYAPPAELNPKPANS